MRGLRLEAPLAGHAAEDALELLGDLPVKARRDAVEELHHRHLGPEAADDRQLISELSADIKARMRAALGDETVGADAAEAVVGGLVVDDAPTVREPRAPRHRCSSGACRKRRIGDGLTGSGFG